MSEVNDETSAQAEWDAEIDARMKDIEEGRVELVSTDDAIARVRAKLAGRRAYFMSAARNRWPCIL